MPTRILLVDDDPNILDTAKDILEDAGYSVEAVGTGAAALQRLEAVPCDLMIADLNLPDAKGVELAVHAQKIRPELEVILMTGEANVDLGPARSAIYGCLTKPVDPAQLIELLKKALPQ